MSKESMVVFTKFGTLFFSALVIMIIVNSLARGMSSSSETPWKTFNPTSADVHEGRGIMEHNGCLSCHSIDGFGGSIGPMLNGVKERKSRDEMFQWIKSPFSIKPGTRMPQYFLSDEEILKIVSYLETKDSVKAVE